MKQIKIDGKTYTLKYSFRAARYKNCAETVMNMVANISEAEQTEDTRALIGEMVDLPQKATEIFYAGLIQEHGTHPKGDGTVPGVDVAADLLDSYIEENEGGEDATYYGVFASLMDCMRDDGFFKLIGLDGTEKSGSKQEKGKRKVSAK